MSSSVASAGIHAAPLMQIQVRAVLTAPMNHSDGLNQSVPVFDDHGTEKVGAPARIG